MIICKHLHTVLFTCAGICLSHSLVVPSSSEVTTTPIHVQTTSTHRHWQRRTIRGACVAPDPLTPASLDLEIMQKRPMRRTQMHTSQYPPGDSPRRIRAAISKTAACRGRPKPWQRRRRSQPRRQRRAGRAAARCRRRRRRPAAAASAPPAHTWGRPTGARPVGGGTTRARRRARRRVRKGTQAHTRARVFLTFTQGYGNALAKQRHATHRTWNTRYTAASATASPRAPTAVTNSRTVGFDTR